MKNITRELNGKNPSKIFLSGNPKDVEREVNRLFNVGVATSVPEDYREGEDSSVVCNTYRKRFLTGLRTLAEIEMQKDNTRHVCRMNKRAWNIRASVRAAHIFRSEFVIARKRQEKDEDSGE